MTEPREVRTKRGKRKRTKGRKWTRLRYRKNDLGHNVLVSVQRWIHANGGSAVVLGGIGLLDMVGEFRYGVVVSATGKRPERKATNVV
jgi:hypothetical protein